MISFAVGANIFDRPSHIMVNPVNCRGIMGKGLAEQFKDRFPEMYWNYREACEAGWLKPGETHTWHNDDLVIINLATKDDWKELSKYKWVDKGLKKLADLITIYRTFGWQDQIKVNPLKVSIPALGCGEGMLDWSEVRKMILKALDKFTNDPEVEITVFAPLDKSIRW